MSVHAVYRAPVIYPGQPPVGYAELAAILRQLITSGQLGPGDRLPSERDLSQTYAVAPMTARAAVRLLREEGLVEVVRGRGVVVRTPVEQEWVQIPIGSWMSARNPTPEERLMYEMPEGVPLIVVVDAAGMPELYPAHRYRVGYQVS